MLSVARKHRLNLRPVLLVLPLFAILVAACIGLLSVAPLAYHNEIIKWSITYQLDPAWVASIIRCESGFRPHVISPAGAMGLMQIMPGTGEWIAQQLSGSDASTIQLLDIDTNIALGTWYLRYLLNRFEAPDTALMAYNAGPGNVDLWEGNLEQAYAETQQYIRRVRLFFPIYRIYFKALWLADLIVPDIAMY